MPLYCFRAKQTEVCAVCKVPIPAQIVENLATIIAAMVISITHADAIPGFGIVCDLDEMANDAQLTPPSSRLTTDLPNGVSLKKKARFPSRFLAEREYSKGGLYCSRLLE